MRIRNLRLIGHARGNFRACENYTDVARACPTNFLPLSLSLSSLNPGFRSLAPLALPLVPSHPSFSHPLEVTQNRALDVGWLVPRCRYHEERMSIARSHSSRERETASADFTALSRNRHGKARNSPVPIDFSPTIGQPSKSCDRLATRKEKDSPDTRNLLAVSTAIVLFGTPRRGNGHASSVLLCRFASVGSGSRCAFGTETRAKRAAHDYKGGREHRAFRICLLLSSGHSFAILL